MEGRLKIWCAFALLTNTVGCSMFQKSNSQSTAPQYVQQMPIPNPPKTIAKSGASQGNSIYIEEPADDPNARKDGPLSPATLVVFANNWVDSATRTPNQNPAERERLLSQARQFYNEAAQREPQNVEPLLGLARMYALTGEIERLNAIEARLKAEHGNKAKVWAWIAVRQAQSKDWDSACESYHKAVKLDPDNRLYRIHLGFTLSRAGRYEEGYAWLARSMRESEARYNLSLMMVHNGQMDTARQQLQFALQVDPNYKPAIEQLASLSTGGSAMPTTVPLPEDSIRQATYQQPIIRNGNVDIAPTPRPMPEPMPVGVNPNGRTSYGPLPAEYTPTTGWDTTAPVK